MHTLAASFFLQMAVILVACRVVGMPAKKIGQPQVVGEMIAGVLLGPSLLGLFWPESTAMIFTKESRGVLYVGAQLGVGLYMFLVGLEFKGPTSAPGPGARPAFPSPGWWCRSCSAAC